MNAATRIVRATTFPLFEINLDGQASWVCASDAARALGTSSQTNILGTLARDADGITRTMTAEEREEILSLTATFAAE